LGGSQIITTHKESLKLKKGKGLNYGQELRGKLGNLPPKLIRNFGQFPWGESSLSKIGPKPIPIRMEIFP